MLSDIPYKNIMENNRMYDVWMRRDVYDNTFAEIAKEYGVSVNTVIDNYNKILRLKIRLYVNHLSIVYGCENTAYFRKIWGNAYECYAGEKYVVAYFEKEYADILSAYRNGEPGMPDRILRDLPPLQNEFSRHTVSSVIQLRETNGMTYAAIGTRLSLTKEKAEYLYNRYYHVLYNELLEKIIEITGDKNLCDRYRKAIPVGYGKKMYDCLIKDYPELCKKFLTEKNDISDY